MPPQMPFAFLQMGARSLPQEKTSMHNVPSLPETGEASGMIDMSGATAPAAEQPMIAVFSPTAAQSPNGMQMMPIMMIPASPMNIKAMGEECQQGLEVSDDAQPLCGPFQFPAFAQGQESMDAAAIQGSGELSPGGQVGGMAQMAGPMEPSSPHAAQSQQQGLAAVVPAPGTAGGYISYGGVPYMFVSMPTQEALRQACPMPLEEQGYNEGEWLGDCQGACMVSPVGAVGPVFDGSMTPGGAYAWAQPIAWDQQQPMQQMQQMQGPDPNQTPLPTSLFKRSVSEDGGAVDSPPPPTWTC